MVLPDWRQDNQEETETQEQRVLLHLHIRPGRLQELSAHGKMHGTGKRGKRFIISSNTPAYYQESQWQKTPEFREKYRKRAAEEWKNAEMKRFHGLFRAVGWGLRSMTLQARFSDFAVNLKRIANLIREREKENKGVNALIPSLLSRIEDLAYYLQMG